MVHRGGAGRGRDKVHFFSRGRDLRLKVEGCRDLRGELRRASAMNDVYN